MSVLEEIKNQVLDNEELDINEKMCLISLMCIGETEGFEKLSHAMGCTENTAEMAFLNLKRKGYFAENDPVKDHEEIEALKRLLKRDDPPVGTVIKKNNPKNANVTQKTHFESVKNRNNNDKKDKNNLITDDVDRVMELIDETLTRSEAAIILGFADGNFKKVEATYTRIRNSQITNKVDALVNLLQSEDEKTLLNKTKILNYKNNSKK